jgi:PAS domain S-box-containing protein
MGKSGVGAVIMKNTPEERRVAGGAGAFGAEVEAVVSERTRADAVCVDSELRYRRLFEAARDGILILDAETGMVVDVNPFLIELLGISRVEFLSKRIWELGPFKDDRVSEARFRELQQTGYARYDNMTLETSDGKLAEVEFISNVYLVDGTRVIQCNVRDTSERRRTEAVAAKQLKELERWQEVTLGREDRVRELKREVNDLCRAAGVAERYSSQGLDPARRTP